MPKRPVIRAPPPTSRSPRDARRQGLAVIDPALQPGHHRHLTAEQMSPAPTRAKPQVNFSDQAQQALNAAADAETNEQLNDADVLVQEAIDAIDAKEDAGFDDDQEMLSMTELRDELYDAQTDLAGR